MRADMQRYYGMDVTRIGDVWHVAACAARLPRGSFTMRNADETCAYTVSEMYLHAIMCAALRKWVPYPWEDAAADMLPRFEAIDDLDEWLGREWKEVGVWRQV